LFLGSSEAIGSFGHLFGPLDKKWKLFRRKDGPTTTYISELPSGQAELATRDLNATALTRRGPDSSIAQSAERAVIQHLVPPAILMHERGEIVHIHGRTGQFLEPAPGPQISANVYNIARDGLQMDLAVAVRHAAANEAGVLHRGVRVRTNGHSVLVDLRVKRLAHPEHLRGLFLVAFERAEPLPNVETVAETNEASGWAAGCRATTSRAPSAPMRACGTPVSSRSPACPAISAAPPPRRPGSIRCSRSRSIYRCSRNWPGNRSAAPVTAAGDHACPLGLPLRSANRLARAIGESSCVPVRLPVCFK